jgi:ribosomal protein S12 methylthiotransferase accessory factor
VAVPQSLVYYGSEPTSELFALDTSSGCAVGDTLTEAAYYGLLEIIERDAFLIAWYGGLPLDEIDPLTLGLRASRLSVARMRLFGQRVRLFDCTVGLPVPTVLAVGESPEGALCFGAASRPSPEAAAGSALAEICSDFGLGFGPESSASHRMTEERRSETLAMVTDFDRVTRLEDHADLFKNPEARLLAAPLLDQTAPEVIPLSAVGHRRSGLATGPGLSLRALAAVIARAGFEPLIADLTTPELDVVRAACAKAIVPGLIPIDFGWSVQRALSMPRLGRAAAAYPKTRGVFSPHLVPHPFP